LIRKIWPGWFLPDTVILKKLKPDWDEEFDTEKAAYNNPKLQTLQGHLSPIFYGEAQCEGTRALVLSKVDGVMPYRQPPPPLPREEFRKRLEVVFQKLGTLNFSYSDYNLGNFLLTKDGVMLVDMESAWEPESPDQCEYESASTMRLLLRQNDGYLTSLAIDGYQVWKY
jgi:hypothetical protein